MLDIRRYENQPIMGVTHICNRGGFVFYEPLEDDKPDDFETYYMVGISWMNEPMVGISWMNEPMVGISWMNEPMVGISWMNEPISDIQLCKVEYELVEDDCGEPIDLRAYVEYGDNRIYLDEVMRV